MTSKNKRMERIKSKNGGYRVIKRDRIGKIKKNISWGTYLKRKNAAKKRKETIAKKELVKKVTKFSMGCAIDLCGILSGISEIFSDQK